MFLSIKKKWKVQPTVLQRDEPPQKIEQNPQTTAFRKCENKTCTIPPKKKQLLQKNMTTLKYPPVNYHNNGNPPCFKRKNTSSERSICIAKFVYQRVNPSVFSPRTAWSIEFTLRAFETWVAVESRIDGSMDHSSCSKQLEQTLGNPKVFFRNVYQSYMNVAVYVL